MSEDRQLGGLCFAKSAFVFCRSAELFLCDISLLPYYAKYRLSELRSDCSFAQLKIGVLVRVPLDGDELRVCDVSFMRC